MCGIPFYTYESYISKLVKQGFNIAICEQMESPNDARKLRGSNALVNREVVRIITPGTITEDSMLINNDHNFLASIFHP